MVAPLNAVPLNDVPLNAVPLNDVPLNDVLQARVGVLAIHGEVTVVGTGRAASFVAFSVGSGERTGDVVRVVERTAIVYVAEGDVVVDVEHEWHERVTHELRPVGGASLGGASLDGTSRVELGSWLAPRPGVVDRLVAVLPAGVLQWVRLGRPPAWLAPDRDDALALWHGAGGRLSGFAALPPTIGAFVQAQRPEYAFAPVVDHRGGRGPVVRMRAHRWSRTGRV